MDPRVNRWTGAAHRHERERERRRRQARARLLAELAIAELARSSAEVWFEHVDRESMARKLADLKDRLASRPATNGP